MKADTGGKSLAIVLVKKILGLLCLFALCSCATSLRIGSPPKVNQLESLKPGISDLVDVKHALGEPRGYGMARLNVDPLPRTIWFYEYAETAGTRMEFKFLIVFLRQDRYDGHFWFSSASLLEQKP